ncbi:DUF1707 SHOCT-like domain-containing protein [Nakamurella leprariae]|uniref:DUF1707 domain-containing protein n=1 Tax=Nakamurella leprariae TaxID=2803911 RepID=A0A939C242_9ACTN|nr:DUF1707 domain-containing protein [Nakamurella leprariae]MBM9467829.1 DUF1707 domain-containing protein [Nakamurella leprariae]
MTAPVPPRDLRVSDEERRHVLQLLERATGRGLIDLGEYTERSATVIAARTRGELNAVLLDLPGLAAAVASGAPGPGTPPASWTAGAPALPAGPAALEPDGGAAVATGGVLELTGWSSRTYRGYWTVPPRIVVAGTGAGTRLDFSQAQLTSSMVTVEFRSNYGGNAELVVPRGTDVRLEVQMRGGSLHNKVPPGSATGHLTVVLTGIKKQGSITVRHPKQGWQARIEQWF